jgi:membrane protease YdiL (CAAX protease family)
MWSPLQVVMAVVCIPVVEELVFRELLQSMLTAVLPAWMAVVITATARALLADDVDDATLSMMESITFGTVYALTDTVLVPVAMHVAWNAAAVYALRAPYY